MSSAHVTIGTQLYTQLASDTAAEARHLTGDRMPLPGADGTLLAIVPIPGTQTSLAIVGYAISTVGTAPHPPATPGARDTRPDDASLPPPPPTVPAAATGLNIDRARRRVQVDGREVSLTFQEFELLAFLSAHPAVVFSRTDLVGRVWQQPQDAPDRPDMRLGTRTVDVHVSRLRRKLGPVYGQCLVTEHRAGYQFRPRPE